MNETKKIEMRNAGYSEEEIKKIFTEETKEETKIKKIKNWLTEHAESVIFPVCVGAATGLFAVIGYRIGLKIGYLDARTKKEV